MSSARYQPTLGAQRAQATQTATEGTTQTHPLPISSCQSLYPSASVTQRSHRSEAHPPRSTFTQGQDQASPYLPEAAHHLLHQGPHGRDVDNLEIVHVDGAVDVNVLPYLSQHAHERHVRLPSTLRRRQNRSYRIPVLSRVQAGPRRPAFSAQQLTPTTEDPNTRTLTVGAHSSRFSSDSSAAR